MALSATKLNYFQNISHTVPSVAIIHGKIHVLRLEKYSLSKHFGDYVILKTFVKVYIKFQGYRYQWLRTKQHETELKIDSYM